jgi:trk system potassium uptake protein TrkH
MRTKPVQRESLPARILDAIGDFASRSAARFAVLVFGGLVGIFTVLFSLPIATTSGEQAPLVDAFFTAVSVICVTGLATVDMATFWSPIGHVFVFVGVEIGGIGVLTLASILGLIISRRLGLRQKLLAAGDANPSRIRKGAIAESQAIRLGETGSLLVTVAISVLVIEAVVAALLFPRMLLEGAELKGIHEDETPAGLEHAGEFNGNLPTHLARHLVKEIDRGNEIEAR